MGSFAVAIVCALLPEGMNGWMDKRRIAKTVALLPSPPVSILDSCPKHELLSIFGTTLTYFGVITVKSKACSLQSMLTLEEMANLSNLESILHCSFQQKPAAGSRLRHDTMLPHGSIEPMPPLPQAPGAKPTELETAFIAANFDEGTEVTELKRRCAVDGVLR
eukprot:1159190-Pelagomonas_calceolata.AAC.5